MQFYQVLFIILASLKIYPIGDVHFGFGDQQVEFFQCFKVRINVLCHPRDDRFVLLNDIGAENNIERSNGYYNDKPDGYFFKSYFCETADHWKYNSWIFYFLTLSKIRII